MQNCRSLCFALESAKIIMSDCVVGRAGKGQKFFEFKWPKTSYISWLLNMGGIWRKIRHDNIVVLRPFN